MSLPAIDRKIVAALSGDLPESRSPFEQVAARVGISEKELFLRIEGLRRSGVLRRLGATVDQRKIGFGANAMAVWRIPEEKVEEAGKTIARLPVVSHCYEREGRPGWPYNLYAMLHAKTKTECKKAAEEICRLIGSGEYKVLFSLREFKKSSPAYFRSTERGENQRS